MRKLVIVFLFVYACAATAIDNVLLNSILFTSDKKDYDEPKISIMQFKRLVDKLAFCETQVESEIVQKGDNVLKIQYQSKDSFWGKGGLNEFTISYLKHDNGYYAYLQTHDRGPEHIWDEERFIPSSEIVDMVRITVKNCEQ